LGLDTSLGSDRLKPGIDLVTAEPFLVEQGNGPDLEQGQENSVKFLTGLEQQHHPVAGLNLFLAKTDGYKVDKPIEYRKADDPVPCKSMVDQGRDAWL
jgi:hypothetical protein